IKAKRFIDVERDFRPQLVALFVKQEQAGQLRIEQPRRLVRDEAQERPQVVLSVETLGDVKQRHELCSCGAGRCIDWRLGHVWLRRVGSYCQSAGKGLSTKWTAR